MIALVFCGDLKYCPYIKRYIERLEMHRIPYTVYFWNRSGEELELSNNYKYYDSVSDLKKSKFEKFFDFYKFRSWLIATLKMDNPSKIVALSTLSGVLIGRKLFNWKIPYVFDIRDYSYEQLKIFYSVEKKLIKNSVFTAISSKGFEEFLPDHDYVIAHNFNRTDIVDGVKLKKHNGKLRFVWNGVIRYFEYQKQYLDALKNDNRFEIVFHGDGPDLEQYKKYCTENGFTNIVFTGGYNNLDKAILLKNADILNNCYGYTRREGNKLKFAVSNRFYDGIIYHIPQLVEPKGFKQEWAISTGIGTSIPIDENFADKLYEYYLAIDEQDFNKNCNEVLKNVLIEDNRYIEAIDLFVTGAIKRD